MKLGLKNNNLEVRVNTLGAYVENFSYGENPIFFPKVLTKIDNKLKARGGMHVCCPNFSIDEISNLPSHGFLRDSEFEVLASKDNYVSLKLSGMDAYEGVDFYIDYKLEGKKLKTLLKAVNNSKEEKNIAPGFHPYFYCKDLDIEIKDIEIEKDKLEDTIFLERQKVDFTCNGIDMSIYGKNINLYAIWTDFVGEYICVEPTYSGKAFVKDSDKLYKLGVNEEFIQEVVIEIL